MLSFNQMRCLRLVSFCSRSQTLSRQFHKSSYKESKKAVIFDMGGVIQPSPFGVANSKDMIQS